MGETGRRGLWEQFDSGVGVVFSAFGKLIASVAAVTAGLLFFGLLFYLLDNQGSERIAILREEKYVSDDVYGQMLNELVRNTELLDLIASGQGATNAAAVAILMLLFIFATVVESRMKKFAKKNTELLEIQERLLAIEEQTLELRRKPRPATPPEARPK